MYVAVSLATIPEPVAMDTDFTVKLADYRKKCKKATRNRAIALESKLLHVSQQETSHNY